MDTKQLLYFITVAEEGSFTLAAEKLGISQPSLSKHIIVLEKKLGIKLFERKKTRVLLTEAGKTLYNRAGNIVEMMEAAVSEVQKHIDTAQYCLRIGMISSCGSAVLKERMSRFMEKYPSARFDITEGNTYELLEKLKSGLIEAAVVRTPFSKDGLACYYGEKDPLVAVGTAKWFKDVGENAISIEQLAQKPIIYYRRFENLIFSAFDSEGKSPAVFCRNEDARTSLMWAQAGLGIAIVPNSIAEFLYNDGICIRRLDALEMDTRIAAVYRKDARVPDIVKYFSSLFEES